MQARIRLLSLLLSLAIILSIVPFSVYALDDLSLPKNEAAELLNQAQLHPQRTGYAQVDARMEEILAPYRQRDTYTQVRNAYLWIVRNVHYSWSPYSQDYAPAYDCFEVVHELTYEEGLQESAPFELVNRAYHAMEYGEGVCYDYAAAMVLLLRYIGFDAFLHTGIFLLEDDDCTPCHHGWTEVVIDGASYILDPQREYRLASDGRNRVEYEYFLIPSEDGWRYAEPETELNEQRDAQLLPVAQERAVGYRISVKSTASGVAVGSGIYQGGTEVTAAVTSDAAAKFVGWFDSAGQLLSNARTYSFIAARHILLIAVFEGEYYMDDARGEWYYKEVTDAGAHWAINDIRPFALGGSETLSREMSVALLAHTIKSEAPALWSRCVALPETAWLTEPEKWNAAQRMPLGISVQGAQRSELVNREEYLAMLMRLAAALGTVPEKGTLPYTDAGQISPYARDALQEAQTLGLLNRYSGERLCPHSRLSRSEAVTLAQQLLFLLGRSSEK